MSIRTSKSTLLHCLGGTLLLVMGLSHLGFLRMPDTSHHLQNVVFPFLTNWTIYLLVAIAEIAVGLAVLKRRGQDSANTLILVIVAMLIWYRFAFDYAGGETCSCLGLLGRELHLGKSAERLIPKLILCFLVATTLPWMIANLKCWLASFINDRKTLLMALSICLLAGRALGDPLADKTVVINGVMTYADYDYNKKTKEQKPIANQSWKVAFSILHGKSKYSVSVTNIIVPSWAPWAYGESFIFDGTNMYACSPRSLDYSPTAIYAYATKGNVYVPQDDDFAGISALWLAFGLNPPEAPDDLPLPWVRTTLRGPFAYGWRWNIQTNPTFGSRFAESCTFIRDTNLDLATQSAELLRPRLSYPADFAEKNDTIVWLDNRKSIPNNKIIAEYKCQKWFHTNDFYIPEIAELVINDDWKNTNRFTFKATISVNEVKFLDHEVEYLPRPTESCTVLDYRYKAAKKKRIFEYASYVVASNQNWRSDADPEILQQSKEFLAHGRKYDDYDQKKNYQLWILGAVLLCPLVFMLVRQNRQQKQTK